MNADHQYGRWLSHPPPGDEVVISGISGQYPEAKNVYDFQDNLFNKLDMVTTDERRWSFDYPGAIKSFAKISDFNTFDAGFFGVHHRQADIMEPMMRKLLENTVAAIIDAGVNPAELHGTKTGVFAGTCNAELETETFMTVEEKNNFAITGYLRSMLTDRISYFLKVRGPSVVVDSACSSSLAALDHAFKEIRSGRCENAIVFCGSLYIHPHLMMAFGKLGVLSPDYKCRPFDEDANGYLRAESIICVFLQKLKNAKRVYAQVIHSKNNSDGYKDSSITFPSFRAQQNLITDVLRDSGVPPSAIKYLEAHGTGTKVGDPAETQALDNAIAKKRNTSLLVGSVKSNIGHGETVSGLVALTKVIIALETGFIPPNINFNKLRKGLKGFEEGRMKLVTESTPLEGEEAVIGINNFGFGGSNTHVLLKRWRKPKMTGDGNPRLVCVSGRSEEAVVTLLEDLEKKRDHEYVGMIHQVFKKEVSGHFYRGFSIGGTKSVKLYHQKPSKLYIYFGDFQENFEEVARDLLQFPTFKTIIERVNSKFFVSQQRAVQVAIAELLKLLDLRPSAVLGDYLLSAYFNNQVTLQEVVHGAPDRQPPPVTNSTILNISDHPQHNHLTLKAGNFLEIIGRLYQQGHQPQVHKLYPPIEFPVSRGTPMIAPMVKWNHSKKWYTYKFDPFEKEVYEKIYQLSTTYKELKYLEGHVVDGTNLIPATEYLNLVWKTFAALCKSYQRNLPVVFENCKFLKATTLNTKNGKLLVSIQRGSGNFEVVDDKNLVATGRIFAPDDITKYQTILPTSHLQNEEKINILDTEEIYREFNLRGYNYSGLFKGLLRSTFDGSTALVQWSGNWTTFLDNVLQVKILQSNTRELFVPTGIRKLSIDPRRQQKMMEINSYKNCDVIKSGGVEVIGVAVTQIQRKKVLQQPVLEKHVFVPNQTQLDLDQSARVVTQFILENTVESKFRAVEIYDNRPLILPVVKQVLEDLPMVVPDLTISSKLPLREARGVKVEDFLLRPSSDLTLVVATRISSKPALLNQVFSALASRGYVLSWEDVSFVPKTFEVLLEHVVGNMKLILISKDQKTCDSVSTVKVSWKNFEWLPRLQELLQKGAKVVVYTKEEEGILGLVNCIRQERGGRSVRCFFFMDEAPEFDPELPFFEKQLKKNIAVNIFKSQQWGTYRHLLLGASGNVTNENKALNAPKDLEEAAYKPIIYSLLKLANLQRGASVLISASGTTRLAALRLCLYYNCNIFVIAGMEEQEFLKREFPQLDDHNFADSEEVVNKSTKGRGVDVVLSGEKSPASLRCLASGGHFLDLGAKKLLLSKNKNYHSVVSERLPPEASAWVKDEIRLEYAKLLPREDEEVITSKSFSWSFQGLPDRSYIIIGGLGGFGLELANWLFLRGARKLVIVTKSGLSSGYQNYRIQNWKSQGATIQISTKDLSGRKFCLDLIEEAQKLGPVDAVFNLALALKDALFEDHTEESFKLTLKPKVLITRNLDEATRQECPDLRYFVVFSSVASGRGNAGQANYAFANSLAERICERRRNESLPGLSIQWGPIGDVGHVARMQKDKEIVICGTLQQKISNCLEVLDQFLHQESPVVSSMVVAGKNKKPSNRSGSAVSAVTTILGIKKIDPNKPLAEMGLDSLAGVEIVQLLEKEFGIFLSAREIRTLTLARLTQIEETGTINTEKKNTLIKYLPEKTALSLVELPSQIRENGKKVFLLPGIEGVLNLLQPLARRLKHHVHGVVYNFEDPEKTIEATAEKIVPMVEANLGTNEPFTIIGYSFGSVVGLELVARLEQKGHQGIFIAIDGSPVYIKSWLDSNFLTKDPRRLESFLVFNAMLMVLPVEVTKRNMEKIDSLKTFEEKINFAGALMSLGVNDHLKESLYTVRSRCNALIDYKYSHPKIKSSVYLFKAKYPIVTNIGGDYQLRSFCENYVQDITIEGDHVTVVDQLELFDAVNKIL